MTFIDVYRRRGLKVKSDKNKGMVLGGEGRNNLGQKIIREESKFMGQ